MRWNSTTRPPDASRPPAHLNKARHKHAAVRVGDAVLLLGGAGPREYEAQYADSESGTRGPRAPRPARGWPTRATSSLDGVVASAMAPPWSPAAAAGSNACTPMHGASTRSPAMSAPNSFTTATRLADGRVLLARGYDPRLQVSRQAWLFPLSTRMLKIDNLHASVAGKEILKGPDAARGGGRSARHHGPERRRQVHARQRIILAGREGYEVTAGSIRFDGQPLLELEPRRAARRRVQAFQYPVEIPA